MSNSTSYIPEGYHTITCYIMVNDVEGLINFLERVFDAKQLELIRREDDSIGHAEVRIGDSVLMLGSPTGNGKAMPAMFYLYIENTDATYKRALEAGAISLREPTTEVYGDRAAGVVDPFGNHWWLATHIENVAPEELQQRLQGETDKQEQD